MCVYMHIFTWEVSPVASAAGTRRLSILGRTEPPVASCGRFKVSTLEQSTHQNHTYIPKQTNICIRVVGLGSPSTKPQLNYFKLA